MSWDDEHRNLFILAPLHFAWIWSEPESTVRIFVRTTVDLSGTVGLSSGIHPPREKSSQVQAVQNREVKGVVLEWRQLLEDKHLFCVRRVTKSTQGSSPSLPLWLNSFSVVSLGTKWGDECAHCASVAFYSEEKSWRSRGNRGMSSLCNVAEGQLF